MVDRRLSNAVFNFVLIQVAVTILINLIIGDVRKLTNPSLVSYLYISIRLVVPHFSCELQDLVSFAVVFSSFLLLALLVFLKLIQFFTSLVS